MGSSPLTALPRVLANLREHRRTRVVGAESGYRGLLLARAMLDPDAEGPLFYLAPDDAAARAVAADVAFFAGTGDPTTDVEGPILLVGEVDTSPYADVSPDPRSVALRLAALSRLSESGSGPRMIVASLRSFVRMVMPVSVFDAHCHLWGKGGELEREEAVTALLAAGYQRVDVVEDPGTFALRGGVMDVFVARNRFPVRLEWFGDEIERLRLFDPDSQRSLREVQELLVHPVRETICTGGRRPNPDLRTDVLQIGDLVEAPTSKSRQVIENLENGVDFFGVEALTPIFHERLVPLWEYLPKNTRWYLDEPEAMLGLLDRVGAEYAEQYARSKTARDIVAPPARFFAPSGEVADLMRETAVVGERVDLYDAERDDERALIRLELQRNLKLKTALEAARGQKGGELLRPVVEHVRGLMKQDDGALWDVVLVAPNLTHAERLTSLLRGYGLSVELPRASDEGSLELGAGEGGIGGRVRVVAGTLSEGFWSPTDHLLVLSEAEIFGKVTRKHRKRSKRVGLASLSQLGIGDYVVHVLHGVGRYQGLARLSGKPIDFCQLEYAGKQKLYLPIYRISEIERYLAADAKEPKLDKMGGHTFEAKTRKVKAEVRQMAEELLQIYAQREALQGHAYPEPDDMFVQFEQTFPFEETPDQHEAINAVQDDLGHPQPMDRLICGDVGFGKTEVALRAAFRVAASGKQVAVLAPTTVLVQQHYLTFSDRMSAFPIKVGCLNRFQSPASRRETLDGIRTGKVDVVVGTHRLLSKDVNFSKLGMVIIDEEQRFGVAQKERFKKLKTQVDVLTMTATPIPRTLHMGLLGMREISLIMTPPADRLAVRTYITRQGDAVIEEAIRRELARGGQVFFVVPRIVGIEEHARRLRELVPQARVLVGHGQMPAELLEKTMVDFVEHRADVLVSTTIIESGLDIPRANTMFVARADNFGLAQLYQLRGRIGRSKLRAYCYLMVNSLEKLNPDARKRLEAIQRHSELGSGFNVASQDLEIRGAGEILGGRQSGNIQAIGFEAYSRILAEAVAELKGEPIIHEADPELAFDVAAFLPDTYVEDTGQRLDFYRRLSAAREADEVRAVMAELEDRYGELPLDAQHFGLMMACKTYGRRLRATALELKERKFYVRLGPDTPFDGKVAATLADVTSGQFRLVGGDRIATTVPERTGLDCRRVLESCEKALAELLTYARVGEPARS
jgi:transcription-repair coupling factor (superfamily II helicase)